VAELSRRESFYALKALKEFDATLEDRRSFNNRQTALGVYRAWFMWNYLYENAGPRIILAA